MKKRIISIILAVIMIVGMIPLGAITAFAEEVAEKPKTYIERSWDKTTKTVVETENDIPSDVIEMKDSSDEITLEAGKWYIVSKDITVSDKITVAGTKNSPTNIILKNDCTLTAENGIKLLEENVLNIYGQKGDTGKISATKGGGGSAIGGYGRGDNAGTLTVHGGTVEAIGEASGIGGGSQGNGGKVTIYGGTVEAQGSTQATGIGGGNDGGNGGDVTIYGGTVNATGGTLGGAGIGSGPGGKNCGTVTIWGGTVNATGRGFGGAGIGYGSGVQGGTGGTVTIHGGVVTATARESTSTTPNSAIDIELQFDAFAVIKAGANKDNANDVSYTDQPYVNIHWHSYTNGIYAVCGAKKCEHTNRKVTSHSWGNNHSGCTLFWTCDDCGENSSAEATEVILVEDEKGTCQTKGIGHYEAIFYGFDTIKTESEFDTWYSEHTFVNYACTCTGCTAENLEGAKNDAKRAIQNTVDHSDDAVVLLLAETAEKIIDGADYVKDVLEAWDYWLTAINNQLGTAVHEHTFSALYTFDENHHWHECTCRLPECTGFISGFGTHSFDDVVDNGDTITFTCECGYKITVAKHIETESEPVIDNISFYGVSLTLSSDISINFYMNLTDMQADNGTMIFTVSGREFSAEAKRNEANGKYYFRCPLTSLETATTVKAEFNYLGARYEKTYSVKDYTDTVIANKDGKYSKYLVNLCEKIANYSHYAQIYLASIHEGISGSYTPMPNSGTPDVESAKTALVNYKSLDENLNDNILAISRSLNLDDKVGMNFYITVVDGYDITGKVTASDSKAPIIEKISDNQFRITINDISAANFGKNYTINIDGEEITASVLSYANKVVNGDFNDDFKISMAALYEYCVAAVEYDNSLKSFTVDFDTRGMGPTLVQTVKYGEKATRPQPDPVDASHIFEFAGWYKDIGYEVEWDFDNFIITSDTTIYGKWIEV